MKKSGFNKHRFVLCTHYSEWEHYHRIRKEQIFDPINVEYDPNHPTINAPLHFHLILYKGINIVAVAHIEFLSESDAVLRSLATDAPYQTQGFGKEMMILLEKWIKIEGRQVIKMHARPSAENFYRKLGYKECDFDDQCIQGNYIDLGKRL